MGQASGLRGMALVLVAMAALAACAHASTASARLYREDHDLVLQAGAVSMDAPGGLLVNGDNVTAAIAALSTRVQAYQDKLRLLQTHMALVATCAAAGLLPNCLLSATPRTACRTPRRRRDAGACRRRYRRIAGTGPSPDRSSAQRPATP